MSNDNIQQRLQGKSSHVDPMLVFDGLHWEKSAEIPSYCPHSIWQIIHHLIYWQEFTLDVLKGKNVEPPVHAEQSWPGGKGPVDVDDWDKVITQFKDGLKKSKLEAEKELKEKIYDNVTREELLSMLIAHNSYHTGQVVLIRQMIGSWPPPSGGDTW